jgi:hypothetical protein
MQNVWDVIRRPNLQIISIEDEEIQMKATENIFNKIIAEIFPNIEKENHTGPEGFRKPNRQYQKKNFSKAYYS